jgi:hypothetical protein
MTINFNNSKSSAEPFFLDCRGLAPFSFSFYDRLLIYDYTTYIFLRRNHRKHIRFPAVDICKPHRKHLFLYCCIYSALHSNGSYPIVTCIFVVVGMCLQSCCIATGLHVTIYFLHSVEAPVFCSESAECFVGFIRSNFLSFVFARPGNWVGSPLDRWSQNFCFGHASL